MKKKNNVATGNNNLKGQDWNRRIMEEKLRGKGNRERGKVKQKEKENWKETRKLKRTLWQQFHSKLNTSQFHLN